MSATSLMIDLRATPGCPGPACLLVPGSSPPETVS